MANNNGLIEEKVNLGRAIANLHLEELVLQADLSDKPLAERASLVKGVLNGKLERGQWQKVLHLVYDPGIAGSLFDGDWKSFTESVIESAKKSRDDTLDEDTRDLILQKWAPMDIYRLATESTLQEKYVHNLFSCIEKKLPKELAKKMRIMLGERELKHKNIEDAYYHFQIADDKEKLGEFYDALIKNASRDSIEFLIKFAEKDSTNKTGEFDQKRIISIIDTLLKDKKLQNEISSSRVKVLYKLVQKDNLQLAAAEKASELMNLVAPRIGGSEIEESPDEKLNIAWALAHILDEPALAYRILKKANNKGYDVTKAALEGLLCHKKRDGNEYNAHRMQLSPENIESKDLQAVFNLPSTPLEIKADIAKYLDDKKAMLKLSREFYKKKHEDQGNLSKAYGLGFMAGKVCNKNYLDKIRAELIKDEVNKKEDTSFLYQSYYFHWLNRKDTEGHVQTYNAVIAKSPETAYNLAKTINDEKLMQKAREKMVEESPERTFSHFKNSTYYDAKGIKLAIAALAEKYSVNREDLQKTLEPAIKRSASSDAEV